MRKKLIAYGALFVFAIFLTACNSTANAVVDYNNEFIMQEFLNDEQEYIDLMAEYEQEVNETDNDLEKREAFLNEKLIPKSQKLMDLAKAKEFDDEEVQKVHNLLIKSEEMRHESIEKELEAVQKDSQEVFLEAQEVAEEAEEVRQEFLTKMDGLIEEYNLEEQEE